MDRCRDGRCCAARHDRGPRLAARPAGRRHGRRPTLLTPGSSHPARVARRRGHRAMSKKSARGLRKAAEKAYREMLRADKKWMRAEAKADRAERARDADRKLTPG